MSLSTYLSEQLKEMGADIVGFGKLEGYVGDEYAVGISVGVAVPVDIVKDLLEAPTLAYYEYYYEATKKLDKIAKTCEDYLSSMGYTTFAQTTDRNFIGGSGTITRLPHKTVATCAGLGWIGKNGLLVTPEYGPAVRLTSILTHAKLDCGEPIEESKCGDCTICRDVCPGQAIEGILWGKGLYNKRLIDIDKCHNTQVKIMKEQTGIEVDLCGKCFACCRYTQKYINNPLIK